MKSVSAGLGGGVDLTRPAAQLGGIGVGHHLKFLNLVDGGYRREGIEVRLGIGSTIEKEVRVCGASPAH